MALPTLQDIVAMQGKIIPGAAAGSSGDRQSYFDMGGGNRELAYKGFSTGRGPSGDSDGNSYAASPDYKEFMLPESIVKQLRQMSIGKSPWEMNFIEGLSGDPNQAWGAENPSNPGSGDWFGDNLGPILLSAMSAGIPGFGLSGLMNEMTGSLANTAASPFVEAGSAGANFGGDTLTNLASGGGTLATGGGMDLDSLLGELTSGSGGGGASLDELLNELTGGASSNGTMNDTNWGSSWRGSGDNPGAGGGGLLDMLTKLAGGGGQGASGVMTLLKGLLTGSGGGAMSPEIQALLKALGINTGGGALSNILGGASGIYGLKLGNDLLDLGNRALDIGQKVPETKVVDPMGMGDRRQFLDALTNLRANPGSITDIPGYQAGEQAVSRSMAANGYLGSGNMMTALQKFGGDFYDKEIGRLSTLAGAGFAPTVVSANPGAGMSTAMNSTNAGIDQISKALASLGFVARNVEQG